MPQPSKRLQTSTVDPDGDLFVRLAEQSQIDFEIGFFSGVLQRHAAFIDVLRVHAKNLSQKGLITETLEIDRRWVTLQPEDPLAHYNLACSYALTRQPEQALESLRRAVECGYRDFRHIRQDTDLDSIRHDPRFRQLLLEYGDL